ncbi:MAG: ribonucleoside triphosphate reductase, partial [Clostridia bacterium]|nr:ribonucleoside triphosphate reductase [Clostridia bacterium]
DGTPYYTNSSHLPVGYTEDVFEALDMQDELHTLYTSGTVFHAFLGEKLPDWKAAAELVKKIANNYKLPYYTLSPTYSVCKNHGYIAGEVFTCPECGETTEVYSRITGYYRPVQNWNDGKAQEYKERKVYDIANSDISKHKKTAEAPKANIDFEEESCGLADGLYLFKTATCPNCKVAISLLGKAGIEVQELMAYENEELAMKLGVRQAPTLVVVSGGEAENYAGVAEIKKFIDAAKGAAI